jgi:DNA-directed RNA polymerase subunit RPC12/RpoP
MPMNKEDAGLAPDLPGELRDEPTTRYRCRHCGERVVMTGPNEMGKELMPICPNCGVLFFDDDVISEEPSSAAVLNELEK